MTRRTVFRFHYTNNVTREFGNRFAEREGLSDTDFADRPDRIARLTSVAEDQQWANDLWHVARAVYLADRRSPREITVDKWTRTIDLSIQVREPDLWGPQQRTDLSSLLMMLTGDTWIIGVHSGANPPPALRLPDATEVALFSGGLDSAAYAFQRASLLDKNDKIVLVAYNRPLKDPPNRVFRDIEVLARRASGTVEMEQLGLSPRSGGRGWDSTIRSRSLLYIATAVCAAVNHRVDRVVIPENGQLALNPALTPARRSACSTRSVHPWTLYKVNKLIEGLGGGVTVWNPYLSLTKGQVSKIALDAAQGAGLGHEALERTVSCGHPTTARPFGVSHCGYCFPCLVRRSGLRFAFGDHPDATGYHFEPLRIDLTDPKNVRAVHIRDLSFWLGTEFTVDDLVADAPLPPGTNLNTVMQVLDAGRHELRDMLSDLVPATNIIRQPSTSSIQRTSIR
ncbi:hypothetical protein HLB23_40310 [Nocardia uniformis]|uniref:7-cyano-7-deazaguanine synthase n=1 Tax=Nocardia uniformis TaxID=53432 RepID=A0A849CGJ5_9NOCA|nr:hypothetical protein [Nocardia uniformis]NNH76025.1 hypothetical protein [Nocardia uniformis]